MGEAPWQVRGSQAIAEAPTIPCDGRSARCDTYMIASDSARCDTCMIASDSWGPMDARCWTAGCRCPTHMKKRGSRARAGANWQFIPHRCGMRVLLMPRGWQGTRGGAMGEAAWQVRGSQAIAEATTSSLRWSKRKV